MSKRMFHKREKETNRTAYLNKTEVCLTIPWFERNNNWGRLQRGKRLNLYSKYVKSRHIWGCFKTRINLLRREFRIIYSLKHNL